MAFSTTLCYAGIGLATKPLFLAKIRNAAVCLLINGLIWTPEFFNPFFNVKNGTNVF